MNKLSVVIITYNEEKNIARCLESVKDIADEIVVMDSFSSDKTVDICKQYKAKVIQRKFKGYIDTKNDANTFAKYPYILSLDADEALSEKLKLSILAVKNNWNFDGYTMNRMTNYCGKWIKYCSWYPDKKLRLFDITKGEWTGYKIHEKFTMHKNARITQLTGDILHYSYYAISDHINQANKFSDISAQALFEKGKKAGWIKILLSPYIKFLRDYFFKLGFLDGFYGYVICKISAHATFLKYAKLRQLHRHG